MALRLQAFYIVRPECQLMEPLDHSLLFRRIVGLGIGDAVWLPAVFSRNRARLLAGGPGLSCPRGQSAPAGLTP